MLSPYTGVDMTGEVERRMWGNEAKPRLARLGIRGIEGEGGNGVAAALATILLNNGTIGGTGLDSLLG